MASLTPVQSEERGKETRGEHPYLTIEVVDLEGRPVGNALLGQRIVSTDAAEQARLYGLGDSKQVQKTDEAGRFRLDAPEIIEHLGKQALAVYASHLERDLVGVVLLTSHDLGTTKQLVLAEGCHLNVKVKSSELNRLEQPLRKITVMATWQPAPRQKIAYMSLPTADHLGLYLPAGDYHLDVMGDELALPVFQSNLQIAVGERQREITIDLPASPLARLIGKPAPELHIKEWKNGKPVSIADLRGKVVLVDFWGYWCAGCVRIMPELFKLHDQYSEKDLVIISVHDDSVASIEEMNDKLAGIRQNLWNGRDLPFLVALDGGGQVKIPNTEYEVDGETTAVYGILSWPTTVLIDQNGIVVGPVSCFTDDCRTKVERLFSRNQSEPPQ